MDTISDELDRQQKSETWQILVEAVPALEEAAPLQIELSSLFKPPINETALSQKTQNLRRLGKGL